MKLAAHFKNFMETTVNINEARLLTLSEKAESITAFMEANLDQESLLIECVPQGSLAHRTIIKPVNGHDFDLDLLVRVNQIQGYQPKDYATLVHALLKGSPSYKDRITKKSRCTRVDYSGDCHVDVVPCVEINGFNYIVNRNDGENGVFERTDPVGYTLWLEEQNRIANGNLTKAVKLMKWLRDHKQTFTCRSVILNVLLGERVNSALLLGDQSHYMDLPTTFVNLLIDLDQYLSQYGDTMPQINDPSCPEVNFNHRWDNDQYVWFKEMIRRYKDKAVAAYTSDDRDESIRLWQELFGESFTLPVTQKAALTTGNTEEFIENKHPHVPSNHTVRISARPVKKPGFSTYELASRGGRVHRDRKIHFKVVKTSVPAPYSVLWKVKNRGAAAAEAGALRGQIIEGNLLGGLGREEPTKYRGNHYVECYIIKDGKCVARDRQNVVII